MRKKIELITYILSFICIFFGILVIYDGINNVDRIKFLEISAGAVFSMLYFIAMLFTYLGTKKKNVISLILGIVTYYIFSITNMVLFINIKFLNIFFILVGTFLIIFSTLNLAILLKDK